MNILFLGDIFGRGGREIVLSSLSRLKKQYNIDFTIINAENSAHGKGITVRIYNEFINNGVDCITLGNHAYSKSEICASINQTPNLIFPINHKQYDERCLYYKIYIIKGIKFCVTNILGEALIPETSFNQYEAMDIVLDDTKNLGIDFYLVDAHFETTGEKRLFAEYYKDYAKIVLGTHTHIQTSDEQIINNDQAFITDVGMCGPFNSVLGRDINEMLEKRDGLKTYFTVSESKPILQGVVISINEFTKKVESIIRIQERP